MTKPLSAGPAVLVQLLVLSVIEPVVLLRLVLVARRAATTPPRPHQTRRVSLPQPSSSWQSNGSRSPANQPRAARAVENRNPPARLRCRDCRQSAAASS